MSTTNLYRKFRLKFPSISEEADIIHISIWEEISEDTCFSWFESLASALNKKMDSIANLEEFSAIAIYLENCYKNGNNQEKECIDVSFTENLFWLKSKEAIKAYWNAFPITLQLLYIEFHGKPPV